MNLKQKWLARTLPYSLVWHQIFVQTKLSFGLMCFRIDVHTPLEGLSGFVQFAKEMTITQLFFGVSGTQNRKDQNFLPSTFSVIPILRYPTFPYCFYYIAILQLSHFREIFTIFLASSDRMYLESYNFLRLFLTSIAIKWWRNFWNKWHHLTTRGRQISVGRAKNDAISFNCLIFSSTYWNLATSSG